MSKFYHSLPPSGVKMLVRLMKVNLASVLLLLSSRTRGISLLLNSSTASLILCTHGLPSVPNLSIWAGMHPMFARPNTTIFLAPKLYKVCLPLNIKKSLDEIRKLITCVPFHTRESG